MSNKLLAGILTGMLAGISIAYVINFRDKENGFWDNESPDENDKLDKASQYLLNAKNKADEMIEDAANRSHSILEDAGRILSEAKEKTSALHYDHIETAEKEFMKIKVDIDKTIEEFKRRLDSD